MWVNYICYCEILCPPKKVKLPIVVAPDSTMHGTYLFSKSSWAAKKTLETVTSCCGGEKKNETEQQNQTALKISDEELCDFNTEWNKTPLYTEHTHSNATCKADSKAVWLGVNAGNMYHLNSDVSVYTIQCYHHVDDLGYIVFKTKSKLKKEYENLTQQEICQFEESKP